VEEIEQLLVGADEEKKRMIMRIVRAVVRRVMPVKRTAKIACRCSNH
jgi:hypothetical protein